MKISKKTFCVISQGKFPNCETTKLHYKWFNKSYCDFYKLNWNDDKRDSYSVFFEKNITHSEGRSIAKSKIPKIYDYYIFIDDDVIFQDLDNKLIDPSLQIKIFLEEYKPVSASIVDRIWIKFAKLTKSDLLKKQVFHGPTHDLQLCIYDKNFVELVYPTIFHGSEGSMHYAQFLASKICPKKQQIYCGIKIKNTRSDPHQDKSLSSYKNLETIYSLFRKDLIVNNASNFFSPLRQIKFFIKYKEFIRLEFFDTNWTMRIWKDARSYFDNYDIDKTYFEITLDHFGKIYNIKNPSYLNRKPKSDD